MSGAYEESEYVFCDLQEVYRYLRQGRYKSGACCTAPGTCSESWEQRVEVYTVRRGNSGSAQAYLPYSPTEAGQFSDTL